MKTIEIKAVDLCDLLEDQSGFRTGYIDLQTGEILELFEDCDVPEVQEDRRRIESGMGRYLQIRPISSRDGFLIMETFVDALTDGRNRDYLLRVLSGKKPFANFQNALTQMGDLRDKWFAFHKEELRTLAVEWLKSQDVDAKLI